MPDIIVSGDPVLCPASFPEQMAALRRRRGFSLRRLALSAGVSHNAIGGWERGKCLPRLPELEATLSALGVAAAERLLLIALVPAPRAGRRIHAADGAEAGGWGEAAGPLPGGGDLLRAMRKRRGLTQTDAARSAGVSQGRLAHWERSEDWPAAERLHALCLALGAHPAEMAALVCGRGALLLWDAGDAEAWAYRGTASPHDPLGRLIKRVYFHPDALRDLRSLALERTLWLRARDNEALRFHLHDACAYRARVMMDECRFSEIGAYADRTWDLARQGYGRSDFWVWGVIASASVLRHGTAGHRPRPDSAAALLASLVSQVHPGESQAWMLCELSLALAEAGRGDEALRASAQAQALAERAPEPSEVLFRRRDHAALLSALGRHGEALNVLEAAVGLCRYGNDPTVRHHLLAAACHLGLGNMDAAEGRLAPALALIERHGTSALPLSRLRPQAEALLARL